jgi:hypothetical protein
LEYGDIPIEYIEANRKQFAIPTCYDIGEESEDNNMSNPININPDPIIIDVDEFSEVPNTRPVPRTRNNPRNFSWKTIARIVIGVILLLALIITISVNTATKSKNSTEVTVENSTVELFKSSSKAEKNANLTINGTAVMEVTSNAKIISITVTSDGKSWRADSDSIISQILGLVTEPAVTYSGNNTFILNANACTEGITLVEVKTYSSNSKLEKIVETGVTTSYFAFEAIPNGNETEETTESAVVLPSGSIIFDEGTYETYADQDTALEHVVSLPGDVASSITVKGMPNTENTARLRIHVCYISEGYVPSLEIFLYNDNNWTDNFSLAEYAGKTMVLSITSETNDLIPKITYQYVAIAVPQSVASSIE